MMGKLKTKIEVHVLVGSRLKEMRIRRGMGLKVLASKTGMAWPNIARIEAGRRSIKVETLLRILKGLNLTLLDFARFKSTSMTNPRYKTSETLRKVKSGRKRIKALTEEKRKRHAEHTRQYRKRKALRKSTGC